MLSTLRALFEPRFLVPVVFVYPGFELARSACNALDCGTPSGRAQCGSLKELDRVLTVFNDGSGKIIAKE